MKPFMLVAVAAALLPIMPAAQASPEETIQAQAQIVEMCKNKDMRLMLLHELTCTPQRKLETVKKLQEEPEFHDMWDHNLDRSSLTQRCRKRSGHCSRTSASPRPPELRIASPRKMRRRT